MYILNDAYQYFEEKHTPYMYKVQNLSVVTYVHHRFFYTTMPVFLQLTS